jgi:predicted nucleotidyltransferase
MSQLHQVLKKELVAPSSIPKHLPDSLQYEVIAGSISYGCSDDDSDRDIVGWCIPPKDIIFPHLQGYILGFGTQPDKFEQWQKHHVVDEKMGITWDFSIYNIVKYFQLCLENNPNMVETLFSPSVCVTHCSPIAQMVKDRRQIFLHKGAWHKYKGYAFTQLHKMGSKTAVSEKRKKLVETYGYDTKYAAHTVRLLDNVAQILQESDLDLRRNAEQLKAIRRGEWKIEDIHQWFEQREKELQGAYEKSSLPYGPREAEIKQLLLDCLEHQYGNLEQCVTVVDHATVILKQIANLVRAYV